MRREEIQAWFGDLLVCAVSLPTRGGGMRDDYSMPTLYQEGPARAWSTETETALQAVFPDGHAVRQAWSRVTQDPSARNIADVVEELLGVFEEATTLVRDNRLSSLIDAIRIESESELLDQVLVLANADHRAAATVIAGGALETLLRHYLDRHAIPIAGEGSISKYNSAVGQARKANPNLYNANDGTLVEGWGGYRNEAAHVPGASRTPGSFARTKGRREPDDRRDSRVHRTDWVVPIGTPRKQNHALPVV